jgi:ubiquinone/menaquinone biosynthesis C-methylase UbiE
MAEKNQFHLSSSAAQSYARQKVPAIFGPMAEATLDAISLPNSAQVLDVACGTGAVARAVGLRLSEPSQIVGADLNPAMIEIARLESPEGPHTFRWVDAPAESMPFDDATFDLVFCQQGLQFFPDKPAALDEIRRVICPGGRLVLTCWAAIPPFFLVVADVLRRHIDEVAATKAIGPFVWNDAKHIGSLIADAGFQFPEPSPLPIARRMSATPEAMREEILATPNEPALRAAGETVVGNIVSEILQGVECYRTRETLTMPQQAHLFQATAS